MNKSVKKIKAIVAILAVLVFVNGCGSVKSSDKKSIASTNAVNTTSEAENNTYINSGLLLGLVKEPDLTNKSQNNTDFENKQVEEYRTLWICKDGNNVKYFEKKDGIIAPYGDKFIKLTSNSVVDSDISSVSSNSDNFYSKYTSYYNYSVALAQEMDDTKVELTKDSLKSNYINCKEGELGDAFISRTETILYVGNKYAAIKTSQYSTGGGTYKSGFDDIKLYDIGSLTKLGTKRPSVSLKQMLGNDVDPNITTLKSKYNKVISADKFISSKDVINDDNLSLYRTEGKWTVQAPLYEVYSNQGNGSNYNNIQEVYDTNIAVPKTLTVYDTLCVDWNTIKSKIPDAKDAVSSPDKDMLVVLTPKFLEVFSNPENGLDKPIKKIPVSSREKIVLNQWATGDYVEKWTKLMK